MVFVFSMRVFSLSIILYRLRHVVSWRNNIPLCVLVCVCVYIYIYVYVTYHLRRTWQPTLLFLSVEFHGHRSLGDYNPWECRARHDWVTFTHLTHSYICVEVCVYMYVCIYAYTHMHTYICIHMNGCVSHSVMSDSLRPHGSGLPGSSVHGTSQVRLLVWVAILFLRGFSWHLDGSWVSSSVGRLFTIWPFREECIYIHLYTPHLLYPFISWWASILAIVNNAAMNIDWGPHIFANV